MEIYNEINKNENIIIALGFFDGIHKGHQKIISTLVAQSKILGVPCAVVSFSDNPANYFSNENIPNISKVILSSMMLSFGGLSVHMQIFSQINDVKIKYLPFFIGRILQSIISGILSYLFYVIIL